MNVANLSEREETATIMKMSTLQGGIEFSGGRGEGDSKG